MLLPAKHCGTLTLWLCRLAVEKGDGDELTLGRAELTEWRGWEGRLRQRGRGVDGQGAISQRLEKEGLPEKWKEMGSLYGSTFPQILNPHSC